MARKSSDDSSLMDRIMNRIKGSGEGAPDRTDPSQRKVRFSIWYFIAAMLLLCLVSELHGRPAERKDYPIRISSNGLERGRWKILSLGRKQITGNVKDEKGSAKPFVTVRVEDPELVGQLQQKGIKFSGYVENKWIGLMISWLLPLALFVFSGPL